MFKQFASFVLSFVLSLSFEIYKSVLSHLDIILVSTFHAGDCGLVILCIEAFVDERAEDSEEPVLAAGTDDAAAAAEDEYSKENEDRISANKAPHNSHDLFGVD